MPASVITQPGEHAVVFGFSRTVEVKLALRRGSKSFENPSVGLVVGEIGSCDCFFLALTLLMFGESVFEAFWGF